jgi:hypothetical protein
VSLAALDERLVKRRMAKHTRRTYAEVTGRLFKANPDAGDAPTADAVIAFAEEATRGRPIGTVLPTRAAVKHYLIAALGFSEEEAQEALPSARGRPHRLRDSLSSEQLATYYRVLDTLRPGAVRTILALSRHSSAEKSSARKSSNAEPLLVGARPPVSTLTEVRRSRPRRSSAPPG